MVNNMDYIYGNFTNNQILTNAQIMHNDIHKLLLYKDKQFNGVIFNSDEEFNKYFINLLYRFGGLNTLLGEPKHMVLLMSTLQAAYDEVNNESYNYTVFRRLILDAHGYVKLMFEEV